MTDLRSLVLLGAGGHAKVLLSLMVSLGREIIGVCDPDLVKRGTSKWRGIPVLGDDSALESIDCCAVDAVNGIGCLPGSVARRALYLHTVGRGFRFATLVHPSAYVDSTAILGPGTQVMAGAVVQADAALGENCIVNTGAIIDHDCLVGDHVHIAPGVTLAGGVSIGSGAFIGAGATVIQGVEIGSGAIIGAGTVVLKRVDANQVFVGRRSDGGAVLERS
ncbi:acetyltransferase [Pollutimonas thiosulfatoxidans]|uniref:PglD N-terminal domain-containing protein n=1 Tax=Pollutimonas thiosulfatoxidans TaxID=2028345 RepID=A0A410GEI9_9BURK|nr:acetyltransferase [Pollutimonas thiosulfatoxidans]QAA94712.1 hypothetical protein CKA81_13320 [Pollutimonas thiosulfatoxidans]